MASIQLLYDEVFYYTQRRDLLAEWEDAKERWFEGSLSNEEANLIFNRITFRAQSARRGNFDFD